MTCIVGVVENNKVYMGADSGCFYGYDISQTEKLVKKQDIVLGLTGVSRLSQIIKYFVTIPKRPKNINDEEYVVVHLAESIRKAFKDAGQMTIDNNREDFEARILLGYRARLYTIDSALHVNPIQLDYWSIGCGGPYALGSLATPEDCSVEDKIMNALEIAEKFSAGVRGPFKIISV